MDSTLPAAASPTSDRERITLLDALRGLSILGIAAINVTFFVVPYARLISGQWEAYSRVDRIVLSAVVFLIEGHFFPIFALLLGMGMALQYSRYRNPNASFRRMYLRRLAIMLCIGIAHATLLWFGDVLTLYALTGTIALLVFLKRSPKTLLITGMALFFVPVLLQGYTMVFHPDAPRVDYNDIGRKVIVEIRRQAADSPADLDAAARQRRIAKGEKMVAWVEFVVDQEKVYQSGTFGQMVLHRAICFVIFCPMVAASDVGWRALGLILLGIYMFRRGWFCSPDHPIERYRRLTVVALASGIAFETTNLILLRYAPTVAWAISLRFICTYLGSATMGLGYMGIVYLLYQQPAWQRRLRPFQAVGRMSLTVYLLSSFLFGMVFYGYGLGWMGRVSLVTAELVALGVLISLACFGICWFKFFQYGPVEWAWRLLTYMRWFPIVRREKPIAAASAPIATSQ